MPIQKNSGLLRYFILSVGLHGLLWVLPTPQWLKFDSSESESVIPITFVSPEEPNEASSVTANLPITNENEVAAEAVTPNLSDLVSSAPLPDSFEDQQSATSLEPEPKLLLTPELSSELIEPATPSPEPSVEATEPATPSPEPSVETTEPATPSPEPSVEATEPATPSPEPSVEATEPATPSPEPSVETTEPATPSPEPSVEATEPATPSPEPSVETTEPATPFAEPTPEPIEPATSSAEPSFQSETVIEGVPISLIVSLGQVVSNWKVINNPQEVLAKPELFIQNDGQLYLNIVGEVALVSNTIPETLFQNTYQPLLEKNGYQIESIETCKTHGNCYQISRNDLENPIYLVLTLSIDGQGTIVTLWNNLPSKN